MEEHLNIILHGIRYTQRTPNSKIIDRYENGEIARKYNSYEELPFDLQQEIKKVFDLQEYPEKYFNYKLKSDGTAILESCKLIKKKDIRNIIIPTKINGYEISELKQNLFWGFNIESLTMYGNITKINQDLCSHCNLLKQVNLSPNIKTIPQCAFNECLNLQFINFDNIEEIYTRAFSYCNLNQHLVFSDKLKFIGDYAFNGCSIKSVKISNNTELGSGCFDTEVFYNVHTYDINTKIAQNILIR